MNPALTTAAVLIAFGLVSGAAAQAPGTALVGEARNLQRIATVVAVDASRNRLTLSSERGELTVPIATGLARAAEFKPGDKLDVGYDILVLAVPSSAAPPGSLSAKIMDIDHERGLVSLQGERGNVLIGRANPAVLADIRVGQRVAVLAQITSIEKLK
ncbi:MAG: hypothetical protein RR101_02965 [Burkholderiaceae bacterium]